ncbi:aldo/keto reductase, partial [Candidatus Omnitrophota bacterium]
GGKVLESLIKIKKEGFINIIGASLYYPHEAERLLEISDIGAVQIPVNLLDHRFIRERLISKLAKKGKLVFVRSIFLQGLFFLDPEELPQDMEYVLPYLNKVTALRKEMEIGIDELSINFVKDISGITSLVVGAETKEQVLKNRKLLDAPSMGSGVVEKILETFRDVPEEVVVPYCWKKRENHGNK